MLETPAKEQEKNSVKWTLLAISAAMIVIGMGYLAWKNQTSFEYTIVTQKQQQLLSTAELTAKSIESFFQLQQGILKSLATDPALSGLTADSDFSQLELRYHELKGEIGGFYLISPKGIVTHRYPHRNRVGMDFSNRPGIAVVLKNQKPYISKLFASQSGELCLTIIEPIFFGTQFIGMIRALTYLDAIQNKFLVPSKGGKTVQVLDDKGTMIMHTNTEYIGKKIIDFEAEKYPQNGRAELEIIVKNMINGQKGIGIYSSGQSTGARQENAKILTAYSPAYIGDSLWAIGVSANYSEISAPIKAHLRNNFILASLFMLIFSIGGMTLYRLQRKKVILEEKAKHLEALSETSEALRESEKRYRVLFERSSDAVFLVDKNTGRYLDANDAGQRLTGRSLDELTTLTTAHVSKNSPRERLDAISLTDEVTNFGEVAYLRPDGSERIALLIAVPLNNQAVFGIARDITELKKSQKMMIQTEKMISVGGMAAGIAHEINNPLGAMMQGAQNVLRRLSPEQESNWESANKTGVDLDQLQFYLKERKVITALERIRESGKKAALIISSMLQFSRKSESNMAPTNLIQLVENSIDLAAKDYSLTKKTDFRNIKIVKEYDGNLPLVPCTETEIEQVMLNHLKNAAWAMANQKNTNQPRITIRLTRDREMVRIEVEDNGPGIDDETRNRVFEPFFTTKPAGEGTGLGLSVSYMIITHNHNGTLELESEMGKGSRFIIRLPLVLKGAQTAEK